MKWFLMCAVLLGLSLPLHGQDEPKPAFDALETSYNALTDKYFPLAVRDVVSRDDAFGYMSTFAECVAIMSVRYDYMQSNTRDYKWLEEFEGRMLSDRNLAKYFWTGYSADPGHDVDVAIGEARSYYEPLLKVEYSFSKEDSIKMREASIKRREAFIKEKECSKLTTASFPLMDKIRKKFGERVEADPAARDVATKMYERFKRDSDYAVEFSKRLEALN